MPRVRLSQGTVHYGDTGTGPAVVFVHGLLVNGTLWSRVPLGPDVRVLTPDLPLGAHTDPMRPDADLSPAGLAKLVAEFLAELDLTDVILIGNDTGGAICQLVAADQPDRLAGLVLTNCDAYDNFLPPALRPLQSLPRIPGALPLTARMLRSPGARRVFGIFATSGIPRELYDEWTARAHLDNSVLRDLGKVLYGITSSATQRAIATLRAFDRPTLLAWGDADLFFKPEFARRLAADIPGARLEWFEGARTFVPLDAPERLAELITEFAREHQDTG